jgi:long-chain acyl-CoA synthetase
MIKIKKYTIFVENEAIERWKLWDEAVIARRDLAERTRAGDLLFIFSSTSKEFVFVIDYCLSEGRSLAIIPEQLSTTQFHQLVLKYEPEAIICTTHKQKRMLENLKPLIWRDFNKLSIAHFARSENRVSGSLALLMFTSGTTGSSQACKISWQNLLSSLEQITQSLDLSCYDSVITTLSFDYIYGLSVLVSHMYVGGGIYLYPYSILDRSFQQLLVATENYNLNFVPAQLQILKKLGFEKYFSSRLRFLTQAGGNLPTDDKLEIAEIMRAIQARFYIMYGQTEASPRICVNPVHKNLYPIDSVGGPVSNGNISVINMSEFGEGEIVYSGPNVFAGYATSRNDLLLCEEKDELHTGDLGYWDASGGLVISGRIKRIAKLSGIRINLDFLDSVLSKNARSNFHTIEHDGALISFYSAEKVDNIRLREELRKMKINPNLVGLVKVSSFPVTRSGKIDYPALKNLLATRVCP